VFVCRVRPVDGDVEWTKKVASNSLVLLHVLPAEKLHINPSVMLRCCVETVNLGSFSFHHYVAQGF